MRAGHNFSIAHSPHVPIPTTTTGEPLWPGIVTLVAVGGLDLALPQSLVVGPRWLPLLASLILLIPTWVLVSGENFEWARIIGFINSGFISLSSITSVILLVAALPTKKEDAGELLRSAACIWFANILNFATWYWRLDGGGPVGRYKCQTPEGLVGHWGGAFLFPQMQMDPELAKAMGLDNWQPGFVDYLFLAFNTSTALSPADTGALSRWAKGLMMIQSTISFTVVVLLAARAVNIY